MSAVIFTRKGCVGKVRHQAKSGAKAAMRAMRKTAAKRGKPEPTGLSSYHCAICNGWHVGHAVPVTPPGPTARGG